MLNHIGDTLVNPCAQVQKDLADMLRSEPWFAAHKVKVIEQNSQELAFLLKTRLDQLKGVSLIVGVDGIGNNYPAMDLKITVTATERVTLNRATQGFATALDAAVAAIYMFDLADYKGIQNVFHFIDLKHEAIREADVFRATAFFGGMVHRDTITNEHEEA